MKLRVVISAAAALTAAGVHTVSARNCSTEEQIIIPKFLTSLAGDADIQKCNKTSGYNYLYDSDTPTVPQLSLLCKTHECQQSIKLIVSNERFPDCVYNARNYKAEAMIFGQVCKELKTTPLKQTLAPTPASTPSPTPSNEKHKVVVANKSNMTQISGTPAPTSFPTPANEKPKVVVAGTAA